MARAGRLAGPRSRSAQRLSGLGVRVAALATIALLVVYHLMRAAATACDGPVCEWYVPVSLLLPLLIVGGALVAGVKATTSARNDSAWRLILGACTAISVVGPIVGLMILRENPDAFVVSSTILVLVAPAGALVYSFMRRPDAAVR